MKYLLSPSLTLDKIEKKYHEKEPTLHMIFYQLEF